MYKYPILDFPFSHLPISIFCRLHFGFLPPAPTAQLLASSSTPFRRFRLQHQQRSSSPPPPTSLSSVPPPLSLSVTLVEPTINPGLSSLNHSHSLAEPPSSLPHSLPADLTSQFSTSLTRSVGHSLASLSLTVPRHHPHHHRLLIG